METLFAYKIPFSLFSTDGDVQSLSSVALQLNDRTRSISVLKSTMLDGRQLEASLLRELSPVARNTTINFLQILRLPRDSARLTIHNSFTSDIDTFQNPARSDSLESCRRS